MSVERRSPITRIRVGPGRCEGSVVVVVRGGAEEREEGTSARASGEKTVCPARDGEENAGAVEGDGACAEKSVVVDERGRRKWAAI